MDIQCINNRPFDEEQKIYPDLTEGNIYYVLGIEGDYYRLLGDLGFPYLYQKNRFIITNPEYDEKWIKKTCENGYDTWYPVALHQEGIFEGFFSGDLKARNIVLNYAEDLFNKRFDLIYDDNLVNSICTD